jgi:hypothetical protein
MASGRLVGTKTAMVTVEGRIAGLNQGDVGGVADGPPRPRRLVSQRRLVPVEAALLDGR